MRKPKRNLSESDTENEITEFHRFIVIKLLEETPLAKLSSFLIEKIQDRRNTNSLRKGRGLQKDNH